MTVPSFDRAWSRRRVRSGRTLAVFAAVYLFVGVPGTAHAYLDPASGSLFLQLLLGGVAGAALALKLYWRKVTAFLSRKSRTDEPAD